jgi:hypothetical protein
MGRVDLDRGLVRVDQRLYRSDLVSSPAILRIHLPESLRRRADRELVGLPDRLCNTGCGHWKPREIGMGLPGQWGCHIYGTVDTSGECAFALVVADFNGDGKSDLATLNGAAIRIFLGNGDGPFTQTADVPLPTSPGQQMHVSCRRLQR